MNKGQLLERLKNEVEKNEKRSICHKENRALLSDYYLGVADGYKRAYKMALILKD